MKFTKLAACLAAVVSIVSASAMAAPGDQGVYVDVGTLGAGLGYQYSVTNSIAIRGGVNFAKYNYNTTSKGMNYDGNLKFFSVEAVADYYPFSGSGFRLTGGALLNKNKVSLKATPDSTGNIVINDVTYTTNAGAEANLEGKFNKDNISPYVGIGWTTGANKADGMHFKFDLGAAYQKPSAKLTVTGVNDPTGTLEADRAAAEAELQRDMDRAKFYPVVKLGMVYVF